MLLSETDEPVKCFQKYPRRRVRLCKAVPPKKVSLACVTLGVRATISYLKINPPQSTSCSFHYKELLGTHLAGDLRENSCNERCHSDQVNSVTFVVTKGSLAIFQTTAVKK